MKFSTGHVQAITAYFIWGIVPIYWKYLKHVNSLEILFNRIIWSLVFLGLIIVFTRRVKFKPTFQLLRRNFLSMLALALLIGTNWGIYVYAVNAGHILEGSLAYFMTPIMNIALGAWLFGEKLSAGMKTAAAVAGLGVLILVLMNPTFPWIALSLAFTFGIYGVIKKKTQVGGLESSFLENFLMLTPAVVAAIIMRSESNIVLSTVDQALLIGAGIVTATPILLFSHSMRSIPLNHTGILQFIGPSLQFIVGYFLYHEAVSPAKFVAFGCVWFGAGLCVRELMKKKPVASAITAVAIAKPQ